MPLSREFCAAQRSGSGSSAQLLGGGGLKGGRNGLESFGVCAPERWRRPETAWAHARAATAGPSAPRSSAAQQRSSGQCSAVQRRRATRKPLTWTTASASATCAIANLHAFSIPFREAVVSFCSWPRHSPTHGCCGSILKAGLGVRRAGACRERGGARQASAKAGARVAGTGLTMGAKAERRRGNRKLLPSCSQCVSFVVPTHHATMPCRIETVRSSLCSL